MQKITIADSYLPRPKVQSADSVQNSEESREAHGRGGAEYLLRERPEMSLYEVTVEREP
jgi:hypothetical protein